MSEQTSAVDTSIKYAPEIDLVKRRGGYGSVNSSSFNVLHGINRGSAGNHVSPNEDHQGFVFFTKPILNLSTGNVMGIRKLQYLASTDPNSIACAIKCMLNPASFGLKYEPTQVRSAAIDDTSPFIPVLTNTLRSLSGWPDSVVDFFTSEEGLAKQVYGWADSRAENYGTYDLTATFSNVAGDVVGNLASVVREYMCRVAEGTTMVPYPEFIAENEIDYQMRIYTLITDKTKRYLQKIACTGAAMIGAVPDGAAFNHSADNNLVADTNETSIPFKCFGVRYNDPIIIRDFNDVGIMFNPAMATEATRKKSMTLLTSTEAALFNYKGNVRINTETNAIEWWIPTVEYTAINKLIPVKEDK